GTTYSIVQTFTNAASQVWHRIEYAPGQFGWVENKVFEKPSLLKKAEQTGTIHSGATSSYRVVGNVSVGTTYSIVQTFTNAASQVWHRIEYAPGQFGWVEDKVFDPLNRKTLISSATVHSGAQQNYRVVGSATKGTSYTVLATFTNAYGEKWYRIQFTATVAGWIRANAIDPIYVSQPIVVPQETIIRVNVAVANVRSMPSTTASISTKWSQGTLKTAQGLVNAQDGKWYQIRDAEHGLVYLHESVISSVEMHPDLKIGSSVYLNRSKPLLYSNPSYSGGVVGAGIQGANYTIVDFAVSTDTTRWYKVQNPSIVAWVPEFELVAQVETRYTAKPTFLYRSATVTGGTSESLTLSQPVQLLRQLGTWWNVETSRGNRGWMLASDITNFPVSGVFDGKYEVRNGQTYLTWKTSTDVSVRYSILSSSTFRIHGNMTTLAPVNGANPAVRTITYGTSGNGTRYADITLSPGYTYTFRKTATEVFIKLHTKGLAGKKIIIDAGHGGKDSGAVGVTGLVEKEVNLSTATYLKQELEARGATVLMIRSNDTFYELVERTTLSNTTDFDAFVSIHADSYSRDSRGSTTFYNSTTSYNGPKSAQLAQSIQTNLIANIGTYNRGFRDATYFVIRNNELPAVLVELAFLSNPTEEAMLKTTDFRKRAAVGITKGLEEFFQK
ncbi:N-acetylmuramoyl-L-alanine amidase, partial [Chryseomicrobium aureum]|uniref:N-acetylmuramoyl-L-alanine amidase n=1 Tax=Chryseomicrobium aureum TaxID=1441723 RepID=UPI00195A029D